MALDSTLLNFAKAFISMFIIIDPLASVPIFISLTKKATSEQRTRAAGEAALVAAIALIVFILLGTAALDTMGISFESFKIAGGLVLLIVGIYSILGIPFSEKGGGLDVAVVLIAVPMITGPGAMSMVIILSKEYGQGIAAAASVLAVLITWILLRSGSWLQKVLGNRGLEIYSRIFGLFVAALAIQFIAEGVKAMVMGNGV
jgi:multiple antibiotic resistance protein